MKKTTLLTVFLLISTTTLKAHYIYISYLSPGIQVGFNNSLGFFYGGQISVGLPDPFHNTPKKSSNPYDIVPALCFGIKKYYKSNYNEKYIDLQGTYAIFDDNIQYPPWGLGIGIVKMKGKTDYRLKGYTWLISNFTFDMRLKARDFNFSMIPVLPLSDPQPHEEY
ncbi:MAG: hypothetical protein H8E85_02520 [Candidatus Marinimicrobia bacterium]|nr:hypothetical protein [Candidatus Neomarinimicrobiota bacterium]